MKRLCVQMATATSLALLGCGPGGVGDGFVGSSESADSADGAGERAERGRRHADAPDLRPFSNSSGRVQSYTASETVDRQNPFFLSIGTNGRACASCHQADQGWTVTPAQIQSRFDRTQGQDPIFRTNDGSVA